ACATRGRRLFCSGLSKTGNAKLAKHATKKHEKHEKHETDRFVSCLSCFRVFSWAIEALGFLCGGRRGCPRGRLASRCARAWRARSSATRRTCSPSPSFPSQGSTARTRPVSRHSTSARRGRRGP